MQMYFDFFFKIYCFLAVYYFPIEQIKLKMINKLIKVMACPSTFDM